MAKSQKRGNREKRKPKAPKPAAAKPATLFTTTFTPMGQKKPGA